MASSDPFQVLGVGRDASADEVRAARRTLAKRLHPDRGGDARRMQELNAAAAEALALIANGRTRLGNGGGDRGTGMSSSGGAASTSSAQQASQPRRSTPRQASSWPGGTRGAGAGSDGGHTGASAGQRRVPWRLIEDVPSFMIEGPPDTTFRLLQAAAASVGAILGGDPPYALDVALGEPLDCWCRLELLPEGASTAVSLYIGGLGDVTGSPVASSSPFPDIDEVRDAWISALNALEWPAPS